MKIIKILKPCLFWNRSFSAKTGETLGYELRLLLENETYEITNLDAFNLERQGFAKIICKAKMRGLENESN